MGAIDNSYMEEMCLEFKSDVPRFLIPIISDIRGQFQNDHSGHTIFSELHVDGAGELNSAELREQLKELKGGPCTIVDTDPQRKESAAGQEATGSTVPVHVLYSTSTGTRATFRHRERAEEALQYSSLIATEELTELLKPASTVPLYQYIPL